MSAQDASVKEPRQRLGELTIELGDAQGNNIMFNPLRKMLRGRLDLSSKAVRVKPPQDIYPLTSGLDIPGQRITLNFETGEAVISDPLSLDTNKELLKTVSAAHQQITGHGVEPVPTQTITLDREKLATWAHWCKRLVELGKAVVVSGKLPEKLDGRVRTEYFNSSPTAPRYADQFAGIGA